MEGAELEFTPGALREIARKAKERDTGARGLRSIVEEVMTDIMFELPDMEQKTKYTVTDAVVRGEAPPVREEARRRTRFRRSRNRHGPRPARRASKGFRQTPCLRGGLVC